MNQAHADVGPGLAVYEAANAAGGTPVVFLHGLLGSALDWADTVAALPEAHCVTFDARGHGHSGRSVDGYAVESMTEDLLGLLEVLDLERPHLVGHSMGGLVALECVLAHPERVASLVLVDSSPEPLSGLAPAVARRLADVGRRRGGPALARLMDAITSLGEHGEDAGAERLRARARSGAELFDPEAFVPLTEALAGAPDLTADLRAYAGPVTAIAGADDTMVVDSLRRIADGTLEYVVLEGCSHAPHVERPDRLVEALRVHLARANAAPVRAGKGALPVL